MEDGEAFEVRGKARHWRPAHASGAGWYFLVVEGQVAMEIRYAALGRTRGFGSIRVTATIGDTQWQTSLFPHRDSGGFLLPLKADVRQREGIETGSDIRARLRV